MFHITCLYFGKKIEEIEKRVDKYTVSSTDKYIAIKELHELGYSISELCKCAEVGCTSYYKLLNRSETERDKENKVILDEIIKLYSEVKGIYGYRRITLNINSILNSNYNHKRIYRLMKSVKLTAVIRRRKKRYIDLRKFSTFEELEQAIDEYIKFYNIKKLQKKLKGMTPIEYRSHTLVA